jgi:plasmid stabilization system protein ParE
VRSSVVGRYVVIYRFTDDELQILRIIHGSRDIPRLFGDPG